MNLIPAPFAEISAKAAPSQSLTMSSREIAELTGKEHYNVLQDIDRMLTELRIDATGYLENQRHPQNGQTYRHYVLPKDLTITLAHGGRSFTFRSDGWFNMTQAAQQFGKRLDKFWETQETRDYLVAMREANPTKTGDLYVAVRGQHGGGTWAHPKLAVFFARWLDVRFAVWCGESQIVILGLS